MYYKHPSNLNDMTRKKYDLVLRDLCKLVFQNSVCAHNVFRESERVSIKKHQAQFAVVFMDAMGEMRFSLFSEAGPQMRLSASTWRGCCSS
jgi:hypothetical protein